MSIVLIPCKNLSLGKSRLSCGLSQADRRTLCEQFLDRTILLATSTVGVSQVRLLTADASAIEIAARLGVATILDEGWDLNSALSSGRKRILDEEGTSAIVILPIDLPCATVHSLARIAREPGEVVIVPDRNGAGTNVLRLSRAVFRDFPFSYGPNSFQAHRNVAVRMGLSPAVVNDSSLEFDVDEPDDYRLWQSCVGLNLGVILG
jgi:2-phospho-L-lactate/phosphoenolpyruvate guanylyltransferase